jgi:exosortase/archaeosortase family protein
MKPLKHLRGSKAEGQDVLRRGQLAIISAGRGMVSLAFLLIGLASVAMASVFRNLEAAAAPWTFTRLGMGPAHYIGGASFLAMGTGAPIKFTVSTQCGALLLAVPLWFAAALVVRSPNVSIVRTGIAVLFGAAGLIAANQLRVAMIGAFSRWLGFKQGFPLGHLLIGSLFSLLAIGLSVLCFLRVVKSSISAERTGQVPPADVPDSETQT